MAGSKLDSGGVYQTKNCAGKREQKRPVAYATGLKSGRYKTRTCDLYDVNVAL